MGHQIIIIKLVKKMNKDFKEDKLEKLLCLVKFNLLHKYKKENQLLFNLQINNHILINQMKEKYAKQILVKN